MPDTKKSIQLKGIWKEVGDWRRYWKSSNFFKAFFFSFAFSLLDMGTDFNFAWSVPSDCPNTTSDCPNTNTTVLPLRVFSPCGMLHPKQVELYTYVFISAPAFWVGLASIFNLMKYVISQCCGGQVHGVLKASAEAFSILIQISVCNGVFFAAAFYISWGPADPSKAEAFTYLVKAMAYLSATGVIAVKFVGLFVHGPETRHLVLQATGIETRCGILSYIRSS